MDQLNSCILTWLCPGVETYQAAWAYAQWDSGRRKCSQVRHDGVPRRCAYATMMVQFRFRLTKDSTWPLFLRRPRMAHIVVLTASDLVIHILTALQACLALARCSLLVELGLRFNRIAPGRLNRRHYRVARMTLSLAYHLLRYPRSVRL